MPVEIKIIGEHADHALVELRNLAVGLTARAVGKAPELAMPYCGSATTAEQADASEQIAVGGIDRSPQSNWKNAADTPAPTRERGQPSPGKSRRTKAEIAEDEAAEKAGVTIASMKMLPDDATPEQVATEFAAISIGENRVGPEDSPEDAAQDAADEAAETAANRDPAKPLTLDDVRVAVGRYQKLYGMPAVVADQPLMLGCKMVEIPDTQEALAAAVAAVEAAIEGNPYGRAVVGAAEPEKAAEPVKETAAAEVTKADVIAAMKRYGKKYDGEENDPTKMPFASSDCTKVFTMLFGDEVTGISKVPATSEAYAKCVAGIDEMLQKNPFKRPSHA